MTAAFGGDATYEASSVDTAFTVAGIPTTTAYTGATSGATGQQVTLSAHLQQTAGGAISGEPVTLSMGAESCTPTTDSSGDASCQVTVGESSGSYAIAASFLGDGGYLASNDTATFTVAAAQATATSTADVTAYAGSSTTFSATLTAGGNPVAGETIQITAGSQSCSGTTDSTGTATCPITLAQAPGTYGITASFGSDSGYLASSDTATLTIVAVPTTTTYTGDTQDSVGTTAILSATVAPAPDGGTVTFTLGTQSCSAPAAGGTASCTIALSQAGGSGYTVTASYGGDASYGSSAASSPFAIVFSSTAVHLTPVGPVLSGSSVALGATLLTGGSPLAGKTLTLSLGSQSCTATTNASGVASCHVTASGPLGPTAVKASFAGDTVYPAASDTGSTYVYAFAPGGGSFVVGDKTDTGSVTFWGAQWSKVNVLSGGSAPDSFKGFALDPSVPQCGSMWSTDPGNSASPPAGPLPAYMAVIVTSQTGQSGPEIYGNTVAIVIVQTNAGYKNDPGHTGTGTVVATLCTGSGALPKQTTKTSSTGATSGAAGSPVTLSATLTDGNGKPVANETVTLTVGSQSCTGKTDAKGDVSCSITLSQPAGKYTLSATFAGDSTYSGSSDTDTFTVTAASPCQTKGSKCESLLADPSPSSHPTVSPGGTLSIVYTDDTPINTKTGPTAVLSTGQSLTVTVKPTSGQPLNYVDSYGGSRSNRYQSLLTFTLPSNLAPGSYTIVVTVHDGDGDLDQWSWPIAVSSTSHGGNHGGDGAGGRGGGCESYGI